jgi:hypothetical protein
MLPITLAKQPGCAHDAGALDPHRPLVELEPVERSLGPGERRARVGIARRFIAPGRAYAPRAQLGRSASAASALGVPVDDPRGDLVVSVR